MNSPSRRRAVRGQLFTALAAASFLLGVAAVGSLVASDKPAATPASTPSAAATTDAAATAAAVVGKAAPDFTLTDTDGKVHHLADYTKTGKVVVLEWFNPDCPFVKKHHQANRTMAETYTKWHEKNVVWLAINSGAPGKQGHGLDRNKAARGEYKIEYPVLIDEAGMVGKLYGAKTTPHMFVIGSDGVLDYVGAIDDVPNAADLGKVNYVNEALGAVTAGKKVQVGETKSYGCSVKYAS